MPGRIDHRPLQGRTDHCPSTWKTIEDVELATLSWVHWWDTKRLLEPIGHIPPVEYERIHYENPTEALQNQAS